MNILICISHVPDTTTKIKFKADNSGLDEAGVSFVVNPYDEFALARSLELREQGVIPASSQITILSVGPASVEPTIRKALAVGGEKGIRIDLVPNDAFQVAAEIAAYAQGKGFDIIMMGKESIDNNGGQVPGMVAEMLGLPFVSYCTSLNIEGGKAVMTREISGGSETLAVEGPFVLSAQKGMAEWRIPNMRGIMQARSKPLEVVAPVTSEVATHNLAYSLPAAKPPTQYIDAADVDQLVKILADRGAL
jgi:electron transfer flavoprotein beta subunit